MLASVDRDGMSARSEPRAKLLGEGFKPSIISRNAASAEERDAHYVFAISERERMRAIFFGAWWLTGLY